MIDIVFNVLIDFFQGFLLMWFMKRHFHQYQYHQALDYITVFIGGLLLSLSQYIFPTITDSFIFLLPFAYPEIHGFGTKTIREIAKKNHGIAVFDIEKDQFQVCVYLPHEERTCGAN